jgi:aryl-alcohol dehydrogenase-like predicted oxidoreductase
MEYRRVGRSDLTVSALGLGGWRTLGEQLDDGQSAKLLSAAAAGGVTLFDLADAYADGAAEQVVGRWLKTQRRENFVITSKVYWPTGPGRDDRGLGRKHVNAAVEASLRRLGTDYLDVYFCHREDAETPLAETVSAMADLVRAGKIRHWGTSTWRPKSLLRAHALAGLRGGPRPLVEQPPYNLLERWVERWIVPICRFSGMGLFVFSPLAEGLLSGKYFSGVPEDSRAARDAALRAKLSTESGERARRFTEIAQAGGMQPAALALAWLMRRKGVTSVLMGASSSEQVVQNSRAAELEIPPDMIVQLEELVR